MSYEEMHLLFHLMGSVRNLKTLYFFQVTLQSQCPCPSWFWVCMVPGTLSIMLPTSIRKQISHWEQYYSSFEAQRFTIRSCLLHTLQKIKRGFTKLGTLSAWVVFQVYKSSEQIRADCLRQSSCVRELQCFILDCTLQPLHFVLQSLLLLL
jgi:hypothetical protein